MSLILQTMITNRLNQGRNLRWAGVYLDGGETKIIEGAYPTACRTPAGVKSMEAEIEQGIIEVKLITNIDVVKPVGGKGAVSNPVAVKAAADAAKVEAIPLKEYKSNTEERFHTVKDGAENPLEPTTVTLPGNDVKDIPEPETKAIFPEGTTLGQEGQKTIEPIADAPAEVVEEVVEAVAEEVAEEVAAEVVEEVAADAPAEGAPKKTRRKRSSKKTED